MVPATLKAAAGIETFITNGVPAAITLLPEWFPLVVNSRYWVTDDELSKLFIDKVAAVDGSVSTAKLLLVTETDEPRGPAASCES